MTNWPTNPDATVNIAQVREFYGNVSKRTIQRWIAIGRLPPSDDDKRYVWRAAAIVEYRKAWELVRLVRRAARRHNLRAGGHNAPNDDTDKKVTGKRPKDG